MPDLSAALIDVHHCICAIPPASILRDGDADTVGDEFDELALAMGPVMPAVQAHLRAAWRQARINPAALTPDHLEALQDQVDNIEERLAQPFITALSLLISVVYG
eukprot:m.286151 g.286151  ORF g.286151 m.286151 type:complete len:105 (-) comp11525_c0_seq1:143-457(-)